MLSITGTSRRTSRGPYANDGNPCLARLLQMLRQNELRREGQENPPIIRKQKVF